MSFRQIKRVSRLLIYCPATVWGLLGFSSLPPWKKLDINPTMGWTINDWRFAGSNTILQVLAAIRRK